MADNKPKANGSPLKKPLGTDAGKVANQYGFKPAKSGDPSKMKSSPKPNGGK
tara:strand:+ start:154 stop:309 length:156 start_codon:yes stop_codon:yes gene_type:complete